MGDWIQCPREPERLLLAWQAADEKHNRRRFAVGEVLRTRTDAVFRYFRATEDVSMAESLGYSGYPAFRYSQSEHTQSVMAAFMRRLPPRGRPDFFIYLEKLRFCPTSPFSDFALLGASEARLPSDGFSLVDPLDNFLAPTEVVFEIAGYRHCDPDLTNADVGAKVSFQLEPTNVYDPGAIKIVKGTRKLGYVNKLQARQFRTILDGFCVSAWIARLNGTADHPRAFIFVQVR
ncbi:HIRAN domain-containing protein [Rhizomicrobium electricum]|nr:HIRAN domain-containing protein [Rhizomicrobium electricum]NIJ49771.1 hypothetical protein [Rhizomicrobium electricum]